MVYSVIYANDKRILSRQYYNANTIYSLYMRSYLLINEIMNQMMNEINEIIEMKKIPAYKN